MKGDEVKFLIREIRYMKDLSKKNLNHSVGR